MAAGLGFKTFTTGEVLTAADVNGYLMQGILVFATEAARNSAITSPQEGQFAFTKDTNSLWYYTGSAWVASGATGDIEGVTAGTGISGGGTSGTVTITNSMATEITAKADLIVGTGNATFDNLPVGTNGHVLTADSTVSPTGLKWAAPAGGGKILQVVYGSTTTPTSVVSTSFTDSTLSASITPSSATSKVLVFTNLATSMSRSSTEIGFAQQLVRASTNILTPDGSNKKGSGLVAVAAATLVIMHNRTSLMYLDSPATTSATTYKIQIACSTTADGGNVEAQTNSATSNIILMEVGA
jgi:hypothetical protein